MWQDGRQIQLGGMRQRTMLAVLALEPGRRVPWTELADAVWGEDPPATVRQQVQSSISALRRSMGDVIVTRPAGYELAVPAERVDVGLFEMRVAEARSAAAQGRPERAVEVLREALALWRGAALTGVCGLEVDAVRLEERRLTVFEECIELELRVGRHADLIAELSGVVAAHPLRERLVAQLMVALYRCGRKADALEVYRLTEKRLTSELGLDPGRELRQLEVAMLREDQGLDAPTPVPAQDSGAAPAVVPAHLPPDVVGYVGREGYLSALDAMLPAAADPDGENRHYPRAAIAMIAGTAGVGKTALAVHWAHSVRDRFPDGQLYVNLRGYGGGEALRPIEALARFLRALGVPADKVPTDVDEATAMYRSLLSGKRMLVLLDNAHSAEQVRPLLPGTSGCLVMVTSRDQLTGLVALDGAKRLTLDVLNPDEATALLGRLVDADRVRAEPDAVAELARLCAHLPLALRIAAANLAGRPRDTVAAYAGELEAGNRLAKLQVDGDGPAAVRAAFGVSYIALAPPARRLFRLLGLAPGPDVTAAAAAVLADSTHEEARRLLDHLVAAHLIDQHAAGRFAFHDLLRLYAAERSTAEESGPDLDAAVRRLYDYYLHTADAAARQLYPHMVRLPLPATDVRRRPADVDDHARASAWLDAERHNLVAAVGHAAAHGPLPAAWLLADTLRGYFQLRVDAVGWLSIGQAGLAAARAAGDVPGEAAAQLSLGSLDLLLGRHPQAIDRYDPALSLSRRTGWIEGQATILGNLGVAYRMSGQLMRAMDCHGEALVLEQRINRLAGQAAALVNLGAVCGELGRLRQATEYNEQALALYRQVGAGGAESIVRANLGELHHLLGNTDLALEHLTHALSLEEEIGNRANEAYAVCRLAVIRHDIGCHDEALPLVNTALALSRDTGYPRGECLALNILGDIHDRLGDHQRAVRCQQEALRIARETRRPNSEADSLVGLATIYQHLGEHDRALTHLHDALAIAGDVGLELIEGVTLARLASVHLGLDQAERSVSHAQRALAINRRTGYRLEEARSHLVLGHALHRLDRGEAARAHWRPALALFTDIGAPEADEVRLLLHAVHANGSPA